jgi:hypothetical protein
MWQLDDESLVVALSHETLYTCEEIDGNISSATSPTRELTPIL